MSRPIHDAKFDHQWVIDKGALPGEPLICSVTEFRRRELAELTRQHDDEIPAEEHETADSHDDWWRCRFCRDDYRTRVSDGRRECVLNPTSNCHEDRLGNSW